MATLWCLKSKASSPYALVGGWRCLLTYLCYFTPHTPQDNTFSGMKTSKAHQSALIMQIPWDTLSYTKEAHKIWGGSRSCYTYQVNWNVGGAQKLEVSSTQHALINSLLKGLINTVCHTNRDFLLLFIPFYKKKLLGDTLNKGYGFALIYEKWFLIHVPQKGWASAQNKCMRGQNNTENLNGQSFLQLKLLSSSALSSVRIWIST